MAQTPGMRPDILNAALAGLEAQRERVEEQIAEIQSILGRRKPGRPKAEKSSAKPVAKKKRMMSAEGRARIAAATRKRWAEFHKAKAAAAAE